MAMMEVLTEAVRPANLPFTAVLGGLAIYWLLVAVGLLQSDWGGDAAVHGGPDAHFDAHAHLHGDGLSGMDGDLSTDADVSGDGLSGDAHADAHADGHGGDADHDAHADSGPGLLTQVMRFVHMGDVPVMIVVSILALCAWIFSMIANHYWTGHSLPRVLIILVPVLLLSALLTRYLTLPLAGFFRALNREYEEHQPLVGRTCVITTSEATADFGQARIETKGAPVIVNVRVSEGGPLRKHDAALLVREDRQKGIFYVVKVTSDKLEA